MPGFIVYVDHPVRTANYTNVPAASGICYQQFAAKHEGPGLNYRLNCQVLEYK